jgi:hypothetical protein
MADEEEFLRVLSEIAELGGEPVELRVDPGTAADKQPVLHVIWGGKDSVRGCREATAEDLNLARSCLAWLRGQR